tara:strand:+ start:683 stop:3172 length:2490 start_codon:yes stop_codon:yes gene_type:complete
MKAFVGIDLGTTNSVISTFDGNETRVWKSPEQNDVTPSVIYIDKRSKYFGKRAYDNEPYSPDNTAKLFKRLMGTNTPIEFSALGLTKTPEECSAEILKILFGYLPEEIRNAPDIGTVITVPAVFNQMQKEATLQAASLAGIGNVALMQEPVAAVMSVMRNSSNEGMFLVFDLGGGTLDIAIAESISGRVSLLSHGGIAMCGGRDFDRAIMNELVKPWLNDNFHLSEDFGISSEYKSLIRLSNWAVERAKIELSSKEETLISLSENEVRMKDLNNKEIYLDIELNRATFNELIGSQIDDSIEAIKETLNNAGVISKDIEKIVFIGGPTNYKSLRDKIAEAIGVKGNIDVNPMTAVAEGASVFAESINWDTEDRSRKSSSGKITNTGEVDLTFTYVSRTPTAKSRVRFEFGDKSLVNSECQIDCVNTGWSSGRMSLENGCSIDLLLSRNGENTFKVSVFNQQGGTVNLKNDKIIITKTSASIDSIPASHSIGVEVLDRLGGTPSIDYIVRAGDLLPKKTKKVFRTGESLNAGSSSAIRLKIWEGEIQSSVSDNRFVGNLKIEGKDFAEGFIPSGAELECEFQVLDSGNITLSVDIPSISERFESKRNFYARQDGQIDYSTASDLVIEEARKTMDRIEEIEEVVCSSKLLKAKVKLEDVLNDDLDDEDIEEIQRSMEDVQLAKKLLAQVRKENLKEIRQIDLTKVINNFNSHAKVFANESEAQSFVSLSNTAERSIELQENDFESHLDQLKQRNFDILWRQDSFVINNFKYLESSPHLFIDREKYRKLVRRGYKLIEAKDILRLRSVVVEMYQIKLGGNDEEMLDQANIIRS